jgi:hypothetical protein
MPYTKVYFEKNRDVINERARSKYNETRSESASFAMPKIGKVFYWP